MKINLNGTTEPLRFVTLFLNCCRHAFRPEQMLCVLQSSPCLFYFTFTGYLAVRVNSGITVHLYFLAKFLHGYLTAPQIPNNRQSPSFRIMPSSPDVTEHQWEQKETCKTCTSLFQLFPKDNNPSHQHQLNEKRFHKSFCDRYILHYVVHIVKIFYKKKNLDRKIGSCT